MDINTRFSKIDENSGTSEISRAHTGLTEADFAIADTGSLVLCSDPEKTRLTSLLPHIHIAILRKEQILPDIHYLFKEMNNEYEQSGNMRTCISLITGPSRTADIEFNLTLGFHGPRK